METWYFVDSNHLSPALNMAMDEALMNWHREGKIPPVLRFYGWKPAGLSVGYFQKVNGKIDIEGVKRHGYELVRRQTGGRAVLHDNELTYSVIVSEQHPQMPASVKEAYLIISKGLFEGFRELDIKAEFAIPEGKLDTTGSAVCFEEPSWYELIVNGKKTAGSAQTRKKGIILQHGSIPIDVDETKLFDMFIYKNDRIKARARKAFGDKASSINSLLSEPKSFDEVKSAFKKGFEQGLDLNLKPFTLNEEQWSEVHKIAEERYTNDEWNYSR
ncbi:lipoate--protein ligase family protein [Halobacillus shinanisalinarum]|uniref:Lipoate--protein ligase family protein n=1 Tax=Halobacillus shinanisalinarum TaxID=2932258 RepID=A0ABY4H6S9_9BACI|nr:biotin/lipoate A/B protein ligase family protein [Halobacillus shinanisalinarum]UOQ95760.1 lipoate--protein ligase family protein [Halobacillus shinanisalinarum]